MCELKSSLNIQFWLLWGKIRRMLLCSLFKGFVSQNIDRRRGSCARTGVCCKLLLRCPAYDDLDGEPRCLAYNDRPGVCSVFPIDERDIKERDLIAPDNPCGFTFIKQNLEQAKEKGKRITFPWEDQVGPFGLFLITRSVRVVHKGKKIKKEHESVSRS